MLTERRRYVSRWAAALLALPACLLLVALGLSSSLLTSGPLLLLLLYGWLVLVCNGIHTVVEDSGFRQHGGPLPDVRTAEKHAKAQIRALFPRYIAGGKTEDRHQYYAAVELSDGRWLNLRGPYPDWDGAIHASKQIAQLWA